VPPGRAHSRFPAARGAVSSLWHSLPSWFFASSFFRSSTSARGPPLDKPSGSWNVVVRARRFVIVSLFALTSLAVNSRPAAAADGASATSSDSDADDLNLENLLRLKVITASGGVAEESDLAPANVFTILASEIANQGWRSVTEVLEHV